MNINDWTHAAVQTLRLVDIPMARLDALVLLEDRLGKDRGWVLAHPEYEISDDDKNVLDGLVARRARHVPLAQLRGHAEFYGREFVISAAVLQPRPESEAMIEALLKIVSERPNWPVVSKQAINGTQPINLKNAPSVAPKSDPNAVFGPRIADVGAGSGALGITAQLEVPEASVDLLEIDDDAIQIAKVNVINHTTGTRIIKSDLLAQSPKDYDILLCNLPYVPDDYKINEAAKYEPAIALFGGPDGLDLFRKLFAQIKIVEKKPLYILFESFPVQQPDLQRLAAAHGYSQQTTDDFISVFYLASALNTL
ncbi:MAG: modification methylase, HemK family protein [Candidatus Saccharibacteria bacterium]|nr:modification methylase, HemK family protein [Candidatus Saccharibacteria bacterium]